ncbi:MAG: tetratricopeptide repeat protein [Armatimonadetes bacterium]|nr:tetratricopeptide repeat protein [Armatimonadota bacterium]
MNPQEAIASSARLQEENRWAEAEATLRTALQAHSEDPNLTAELGLLLCLNGEEDDAAALLDRGAGGMRGSEFVRLLAHHFHCRGLAAKKLKIKDPAAAAGLRTAKSLAAERGVSLEPWPGIRLSACLIVRDEEENLPACLESLKGVADEIVVVDTGSRDATVSVAERYGAKIGHFEWNDDFSAARNHALSLAEGDWALWIDADERLDATSRGPILSGIVRPHFGGYTIPIINYLNEDEAQDQVVHKPCRLFRLVEGARFEGRIHEQIADSLRRKGLPIARMEGAVIHHYGYQASQMRAKDKHRRNLEMLRREVAENPEDGFHWFNLGNAHYTAEKWEESRECCEKAVEYLEPGIPHGQFCYQLWAFALFYLQRYEEALKVCEAADSAGFGGQLIEYARAFALKSLGRAEDALESVRESRSLELGDAETGDRSIEAYKARFLEAQILSTLSETEAAVAAYQEVLQKVPGFTPARLGLSLELKRLGRLEEALAEAEGIVDATENGLIAADLAVLCAKELGRPHDVRRVRERAWTADPDDKSLWWLWVQAVEEAEDWPTAVRAYSEAASRFEPEAGTLINAGRALRSVGKYRLALQCFESAAALEPENANAYLNAADLLYKCENYCDAAQAYKAGVILDESNAEAWFTLGNALYKMGAADAAVLALERALRLEPGHENAAHNLETVKEEIAELAS